MMKYKIIKCKEHYNIVDQNGNFICSADTKTEAIKDVGHLLGKEEYDTGGSTE